MEKEKQPYEKAFDLSREDGHTTAAIISMFGIHVGEAEHLDMGRHQIHCELTKDMQKNIIKFGLHPKFREMFYAEIESYFSKRTFLSLRRLKIMRGQRGPVFSVEPGDCACLGNHDHNGYSPHNIDGFEQRDALANALRIFLDLAYKYFMLIDTDEKNLDKDLPLTYIKKLKNIDICHIEAQCQNGEDNHYFDSPCQSCLRRISNQLSSCLKQEDLKDNFKNK